MKFNHSRLLVSEYRVRKICVQKLFGKIGRDRISDFLNRIVRKRRKKAIDSKQMLPHIVELRQLACCSRLVKFFTPETNVLRSFELAFAFQRESCLMFRSPSSQLHELQDQSFRVNAETLKCICTLVICRASS